MTISRFFRWLAALAFVSSFATAQLVTVHSTIGTGAGTPASGRNYLHFDLYNCGNQFPVRVGTSVFVSRTFDVAADKTGVAAGTVVGNDQITCGGAFSTQWRVSVLTSQGSPVAGPKRYFICSAAALGQPCAQPTGPGGVFDIANAGEAAAEPPPIPGLIPIWANPLVSQTWKQPSGTTGFFFGNFDFSQAVVTGLNIAGLTPSGDVVVAGPGWNVVGLLGSPLPALDVGFLNWTGAAFAWTPISSLNPMVYPPAGVGNSTGSSWGTSYTVGAAAGNLAVLDSGGKWLSSMIPDNAANTSGNASTADAFISAPSKCAPGQVTQGVDAHGNAQGCVPPGGGAVDSVFGRTGVVVAVTGDYDVSQVTGAAPLDSPAFTTTATAPTPSLADNSTKIATTAYVQGQGFGVGTGNTTSGTLTAGVLPVANGAHSITNSSISDDGLSVSIAEPVAIGTGSVSCPAGSNCIGMPETNVACVPTVGHDCLRADSVLHKWVISVNGGAETTIGTGGTVTSVTCGTNLNGGTITTTGTCDLSATPALGTDNSVAGTLTLANSAAAAHTIWASGATTTNTVKGPATVPATGHLLDCSTSSTACTLHDSGIATSSVLSAPVALSSLATQAADTVVLNSTASTAAPTAVALPTTGTNGCAGTTDSLIYNTTSHALGCHQISAGAGTAVVNIPFDQCTPGQTANAGNSFFTTVAFTYWDAGVWEFVKNTAADIWCSVRVPHNLSGTTGSVIADFAANDTTASHTVVFNIADVITTSLNLQTGTLTDSSTCTVTTTTTAYANTECTFAVHATLAADQILVVKIHQAASASVVNDVLMPPAMLQVTETF